eukprot:g48887.t1
MGNVVTIIWISSVGNSRSVLAAVSIMTDDIPQEAIFIMQGLCSFYTDTCTSLGVILQSLGFKIIILLKLNLKALFTVVRFKP